MSSSLPQTIADAAAQLRSGEISAVELTRATLERCHASQESIASFITICDETSLAAAQQADADFAAGIDRGPLQGIPLAIKDIICTLEAPTTANSNVLDRAWGADRDATVTRKLREAGAIMIGKLGLNEFAIGWPDPATGFRIPKNPWNLERTPGGSSSGTGAAVGAGVVLGGLGTDTGGSVRGPASYCGISGLKPTFGRVSKQGCVPLGYTLDNIGPMTRTVYDCALMMQAMAGFDPADPCSVNVPVPDMVSPLDGDIAGMRVGVLRDYLEMAELNSEVRAAIEAAIETLAGAGAVIVDLEAPLSAAARAAHRVTIFAEAYAYHERDLQQQPEVYGKYTRQTLMQGAFFSAADYMQAQRVREVVRAAYSELFAQADVLVMPTMTGPAPTFAEWDPLKMMTTFSFMGIWNLTGFPALSINSGFTTNKLPIGMQIVGRPFDEATVFKVGDAYQRLTDWHSYLPPLEKELFA